MIYHIKSDDSLISEIETYLDSLPDVITPTGKEYKKLIDYLNKLVEMDNSSLTMEFNKLNEMQLQLAAANNEEIVAVMDYSYAKTKRNLEQTIFKVVNDD